MRDEAGVFCQIILRFCGPLRIRDFNRKIHFRGCRALCRGPAARTAGIVCDKGGVGAETQAFFFD